MKTKSLIIFAFLAVILALAVPAVAHSHDTGPQAASIASLAVVALLTKNSFPDFIANLSKAETDPFWAEFQTITKDAATAIENLRLSLGKSELDVATALGLKDAMEWVNYVKSGKGIDVTADGVVALAKLFNKMPVAELAAKMVADPPADPNAGNAGGNTSGAGGTTPAPGQQVDANGNAIKSEPQPKTTRKSAQARFTPEPSDVQKSAGGESKEERIAVMKMSLAGIRKSLEVKKDSFDPIDFTPGSYIPEQANGLMDLMVDQSEILSLVTTIKVPEKKFNAEQYTADNIRLMRLPVGWPSDDTNYQKGVNSRLQLDCSRINVDYLLSDETIKFHQKNIAGLENIIFDKTSEAIRNRLAYIALRATADSTSETVTDEASLGIGWLKLADSACPGGQKITATADDPEQTFDDLISGQVETNEQYYSADQLIVCGNKDWRKYIANLKARTDGIGVILGDINAVKQFEGHKILPLPNFPTGSVMLTKMDNLVLGLLDGDAGGMQVGRFQVPGGVLYRISMWVDFGLINANAMSVAKAA